MTSRNSLVALLSSVNKSFELAKAIREGAADSTDGALRMAELVATIIDCKFYVAEVEAFVRDRERRISELEQALQIKGHLIRFEDAYYETDSDGQRAGSPYCSRCWEADHRAIHLSRAPLVQSWLCPQCKSTFTLT